VLEASSTNGNEQFELYYGVAFVFVQLLLAF